MKIIITMQLPYVPLLGGANKCNRLAAEALAKKNHDVRVIVPATNEAGALTLGQFHDQLAAQGIHVQPQPGVDIFHLNGVEVHALHEPAHVRSHLRTQIQAFDPDWIFVSGEEWSQGLLDAALQSKPSRVIYLVHTVLFLPFGPQAFFPSEERTKLLRRAMGIVACSQFVHDYIQTWSGLESMVFHFPAYGSGPFHNWERSDSGYVTLINPSVGKGLAIFLALAGTFPDVAFAYVPTWGTTKKDHGELESLPNMTELEPSEDIDRIFARTRILLLPSLWPEGLPLSSVEAMLRGIPVLASQVGGLPEAKLGTDFVLPVRPIERFTEDLDDRLLPIPIVPMQTDDDINQWRQALQALLSDKMLYDRHAQIAKNKALEFVSGLSINPLEEFLGSLTAHPSGPISPSQLLVETPPFSSIDTRRKEISQQLASLTPEQLALLFQWLQASAIEDPEATHDNLVDLLKNIDDLSEEEAQVLLEQEQQKSTHTHPPP